MPAVFGDLNQRRFRVTNTRKMHFHEIEGIVLQSGVLDFVAELSSKDQRCRLLFDAPGGI